MAYSGVSTRCDKEMITYHHKIIEGILVLLVCLLLGSERLGQSSDVRTYGIVLLHIFVDSFLHKSYRFLFIISFLPKVIFRISP